MRTFMCRGSPPFILALVAMLAVSLFVGVMVASPTTASRAGPETFVSMPATTMMPNMAQYDRSVYNARDGTVTRIAISQSALEAKCQDTFALTNAIATEQFITVQTKTSEHSLVLNATYDRNRTTASIVTTCADVLRL